MGGHAKRGTIGVKPRRKETERGGKYGGKKER